jgi:hypothetical protein
MKKMNKLLVVGIFANLFATILNGYLVFYPHSTHPCLNSFSSGVNFVLTIWLLSVWIMKNE